MLRHATREGCWRPIVARAGPVTTGPRPPTRPYPTTVRRYAVESLSPVPRTDCVLDTAYSSVCPPTSGGAGPVGHFLDSDGALRRRQTTSELPGVNVATSVDGDSEPRPADPGPVRVIPIAVQGIVCNGLNSRPDSRHVEVRPIVENSSGCNVGFAKWGLRLCGHGDLVEDWTADQGIRNDVSVEMTYSDNYKVKAGEPQANAVAVDSGIDAASDTHRVEVVPRFVAQVVVALHMKLGRGAKNREGPEGKANVALVRREIVRLLREYNVRDMDAVAQMDYIERCFFEDDTHSRLPNWRKRAAARGRFVRWLVGEDRPAYNC